MNNFETSASIKFGFGKFEYDTSDERPILIYGIGELGRLALQYFSSDSPYVVAGFLCDPEFMPVDKKANGLDVYDSRELGTKFLPETHRIFVAFSGVNLSYPRSNKVQELKEMGYTLPSYVSSFAFIAPDAVVGSNVLIFEHNTIQSEVIIEDSSILWSGNHIGHQTKICSGSFISSHVCIGGRTVVGNNSYLGMNSTVRDQIVLGSNSVVGSNSYVNKNFEGNGVVFGSPAKLIPTIDPFKAVN
jgi:sugar O-acyltransferase (sialic acid O-acetyltransferase NeuD family)